MTYEVKSSVEASLASIKPTPKSIGILALCVVIAACEGYDVQVMAIAAPLLAKSWTLVPKQIGLLLTASVLGIVLGSLVFAPSGDRIGRRPSTLIGIGIAALFTGASAFAPDIPTLLIVRILAGIGLGLAIPNVIAIAMETSPRSWKTNAVLMVSCGYPLGAVLMAPLASFLATAYSFQGVFLLGAASTGLAFVLTVFWLPESPWLLARSGDRPRLERLLRALGIQDVEKADFVAAPTESRRVSRAALFAPDVRRTTFLLWLLNFAGICVIYFFVSWLPSLLSYRGMGGPQAIIATALFNGSGVVGALIMAISLRRYGATFALACAYAAATVGTLTLALVPTSGSPFLACVAFTGMAVTSSQFALTAVVNHVYPAEIRVTAAGYALGVGRIGAVLAPIAGTIAVQLSSSPEQVFMVTAVPCLLALATTLLLRGEARVQALRMN
jgi:AAHS family 4-hydroxybenzoate transporter-like MFS transporter